MKKIAKIEVIKAGSNPDVDSDFHREYREKAIEHVKEIYGNENVANIVTFGTLAAKGAFKELSTIYNKNFAQANKIASLVPPPIEGVDCKLADIYNPESDRYGEGADFREAVSGEDWQKIVEGARNIEGRNKSTGVHACFVAGTLIKTLDGYKEIENIEVGNYVLTHTNTYKEVVDTMTTEDGEIFYLQAANSLPSKVTGNHPFYVRSIIRNPNKPRELSEPVWKTVDELSVNDDLIGIPVNQDSKIPDSDLNLPFEDPSFWWVAGRFLGDGWCEEFDSVRNRKRKDSTPYEYKRKEKDLVISVGYNDPTHDYLIEAIEKNFKYRISPNRTTNKVYIHGDDVFEYFKKFGKYAVNKEVPDEVLCLPIELLKSFVEGYLSADGHYEVSNEYQSFSTVSKKLTLSMIAAINKVYKTHCSVAVSKRDQMVIEGRIVNCHDKYTVSFKEGRTSKLCSFYEDGYIWAGLAKVEKTDDEELTYNFSVLDDNSYVANGLIVHNCGLILSNVPLSDVIPLHVRQSDERIITQWTYPECESLGLIKMDFLGLDTVDLIQNSVSNIIKNGKTPPNMIDIIHGDMNDPKVYKLFQEGHTTGIFQFGSEMVRNLLLLTKPTEFKDLPAITSVARPGPMRMQSHIKYADRKNGREEIDFIHPEFKGTVMEEILGKTYGLCIPIGTPILDTTTGIYTPIEKLKEGISNTPSYNHNTGDFENKTVTKVFNTGNKKIVKITLNGNRTLRVSETHPVLTSRGYIEAGKLKENDRVVIKNKETNLRVKPTISENRAYFLGAMLGDGSFTSDNQPFITNNDESIIAEMVQIAESEFDGVYAKVKEAEVRQNKSHSPVVTFRNYPLNERANYRHLSKKSSINAWFAELGYERKVLMYDKYIPESIFSQPNSVLRNVVAGLWDTDGTVSKTAVHFTTTSENLYKTMKQALDRLGVDFGVVKTPYQNSTREDRTAYRIYPVYVDFEEKIQPYLRSKKRKEAVLNRADVASNGLAPFYDIICMSFYEWMKENDELRFLSTNGFNHAKKLGKIGWKAGKSYLNNKYDAQISSRIGFVKYVIENNMVDKEMLLKAKNRYRRVIKIEEDGFEECYDIEVADNHSFIVDGVVVHNCIYQEQVQQISNKVAGMTLQEGDDLRRAMGKKKQKVMDAMRPKFFEGVMANGFSEEAVRTLWDTLEPFAKYGFNKSHAVAYAMNSYQSAYLKTHYPVEFMAALIAQYVDNKDKTLDHLREANRMGLKVSTVNINLSDVKVSPNYSKDKNQEIDIFFGLAGVKAVSSAMAQIIIDERERNGAYSSVKDVIDRCYPLGVRNKKIYENLALAGAFDTFGVSRKQVFLNLPQLIDAVKTDESKGESLFDMFEVSDDSLTVDLTGEDYPFLDRLKKEAEMIGLYLTAHPTDKIGQLTNSEQYTKINKLVNVNRTTTTTIIGSLLDIVVKRGKSGGKSILLNIDDGTGFLSANVAKPIIHGIDKNIAQERIRKIYESGKGTVKTELLTAATNIDVHNVEELEKYGLYVMNITFRPSKDNSSPYGARVNWIRPLQLADDGSLPIRIRFKKTKNTAEKMEKLNTLLAANLGKKIQGDTPIYTVLYDEKDLIKNDESLYMFAFDEIEASHDSENPVTRVWPPKIPKTINMEKRVVSTEDLVLAIENLPYKNSGYTTQKTQKVEQIIEKYVGYGAYDFGVFNPNSLEDE